MSRLTCKMLVSVLIEELCFLAAGLLLNNQIVFNPRVSTFSFIIFGSTAVILFNLLVFRARKDFYFAALAITFITLLTYFRSLHPAVMARNTLWFASIAGGMLIMHRVLRTHLFRRLKFGSFTVWMFCFAVIYLFMTTVNTFVFRFYPFSFFLQTTMLSLKFGFTMGFGIGMGYEIVKTFSGRIVDIIADKITLE